MLDETIPPEKQKRFERRFEVVQPRRSRLPIYFGIALALLLIVWPSWAGFYTTMLWFQDLGYQNVFSTTLRTQFLLGLSVGLVSGLLVWLSLKLALRLAPVAAQRVERFFTIEGERIQAPDFGDLIGKFVKPAAVVVGALTAIMAWNAWEIWLRFRHQTPFGESDPIFGRDIGFYFFTLPALEALARLLFLLVVVCLIGAGAIYFLRAAGGAVTSLQQRQFAFALPRGPRAHLLALVGALFLVFSFEAWLAMPNLLFSGGGPVAGATYTDVNATLPLLRAQAIVAGLVAIFAVACIFARSSLLLWGGLALYGLTLVAGWVYPSFVQRFSVAPNELAKETPYIQHNINATRKAFGLDQVEERELTGASTLTAKDIQDNQRTIRNIRLWDQGPLLSTFGQLQEIRTYYEFRSVDNDRYQLNGQPQQVMLSARELKSDSLPNRNWINEHLTFTHGYGVTLGPVDKVTNEGLPELYIRDIPPVSSIPSLKIERPEIYFGELSSDRVYVKTKAKEFNYPSGEENVFSDYNGGGGVAIGSTWRQLLFATRFADLKLLLSNDLTSESRVLFHREISERLNQVAPFLRFDSDPYLVISEGRLFWIADAYTTDSRYPYSQPVGGAGPGQERINYIRNSVKAVVDAYHGDVKLYIADERDPLIQTYARIFPGALRPLAEMPAGLRAHLRYPEDIFRIQTQVYSTYQMDQPQVFYNKEDQWEIASVPESAAGGGSRASNDKPLDPYYTIMKLPGGQTEEFLLMIPFVPRGKSNLSAWMVARADGEHYGKLLVYRFPKQKQIFGPKQIVARINQDPEISRQLSLWNQRGSQVIFGTLMVIPIRESLIYVQPLYLQAESGRIPELRRVIVVAENRIAMEPTLDESLARLFGSAVSAPTAPTEPTPTQAAQSASVSQPTAPPTASIQSLSAQARQHYDRAIQAQRDGDWARYGEELKRLGAVLEQISKIR